MFRFLRDWRRRRFLTTHPFPRARRADLESLPFYAQLSEEERTRLRDIARVLIREKSWRGMEGLALTERMKLLIAAQAALPILNIEHDYYADVETVYVFPSSFVHREGWTDEHGIRHSGQTHLVGEATYSEQVLLAWDESVEGVDNAEDGRNVVLHEFAHRLDMAEGEADGVPRLGGYDQALRWREVMTREYRALEKSARSGRRTVLDKYGAENPAEFFAVCVEAFFEKPASLKRRHPELYAALSEFFRQDPVSRLIPK